MQFYTFLKGNYKDSMFLYDTTSDEVKNVIDKLEGKTSCSVDDISRKVVCSTIYISATVSYLQSNISIRKKSLIN